MKNELKLAYLAFCNMLAWCQKDPISAMWKVVTFPIKLRHIVFKAVIGILMLVSFYIYIIPMFLSMDVFFIKLIVDIFYTIFILGLIWRFCTQPMIRRFGPREGTGS
jgi:hypothetical protein